MASYEEILTPRPPFGRAIGVVLMILGVGLLAVVTATVAAYFVEQDEGSELADVRERLERIEALLQSIHPERDSSKSDSYPGVGPPN